MSRRAPDRALVQLARLHGVQSGYQGTDGRRHRAGDEALMAVLGAMGVELSGVGEATEALRRAQEERRRRPLEPVIAHRSGGSVTASLSLPAGLDPARVWVSLHHEDGAVDRRRVGGGALRAGRASASPDACAADEAAGVRRYPLRLRRGGLPPGYHRLAVEGPGLEASSLVISAPARLPAPLRQWGIGLPLYALRTRGDWGVGSYGDLATLARWAGGLGAGLVGTLPLFASFLDAPGADPSPYLPASRLAWNELFLDVEALPELAEVPEAAAQLASPALREQLVRLRRSPLAHPAAALALKRRLLEPMARQLSRADPRCSPRRAALDAFVDAHPEVRAYARFRAARQRMGERWSKWPTAELRAVRKETSAARRMADDPLVAYHLYVQWAADTQLADAANGPGAPAGLYLDLPVGVHPQGFDPCYEPEVFVAGVTGGAPPDDFYPGGQTWGFPPLHPEALRAQEYRYLVGALRTVMRHATALRIDHVMGLHRMYWVPEGAEPRDGVYVNYHGDELHALVVLEAQRSGTVVAGEDLGTVPTTVERAMARDRMLSSHVLEFESTVEDPLPSAPRRSVASFATHDLPPFAAFWRGLDIGDRRRRDLLDAEHAGSERRQRARWRSALLGALPSPGLSALPADGAAVEERRALHGCLRHLAAGAAEVVMVDLEDLQLETEPQNRPGTGPEAGNFRRRARHTLEEVTADAAMAALLRQVDTLRRPELGTEGPARRAEERPGHPSHPSHPSHPDHPSRPRRAPGSWGTEPWEGAP